MTCRAFLGTLLLDCLASSLGRCLLGEPLGLHLLAQPQGLSLLRCGFCLLCLPLGFGFLPLLLGDQFAVPTASTSSTAITGHVQSRLFGGASRRADCC